MTDYFPATMDYLKQCCVCNYIRDSHGNWWTPELVPSFPEYKAAERISHGYCPVDFIAQAQTWGLKESELRVILEQVIEREIMEAKE